MKNVTTAAGLLGVIGLACACEVQADVVRGLLVPDWSNDRIMLLSREDGSYINPDFINDVDSGMPALSSPKKARRIGNEIWVSDQIEDAIRRYSLDGTQYLGDFTNLAMSGVDNMRGFELAFGKVYICCDSGVFINKVVIFNVSDGTTPVATVSIGGSFDCTRLGNEVLVADQDTDDIIRVDMNGNIVGTFVDSTANAPLDWPQGIVRKGSEIYIGCFNTPATGPLKWFDLSGNQLGAHITAPNNGLRSAWRLDNGNLIWTNGSGTWVKDDVLGLTLNATPGTNAQNLQVFNNCLADYNDDGVVDFFDYLDFVAAFSTNEWDADYNLDGVVDFFDYLDFVAAFSSGC